MVRLLWGKWFVVCLESPAVPCRAGGQVLVETIIRPVSAMQAERYRTCLYLLINRWDHWRFPFPRSPKTIAAARCDTPNRHA